MSNQADVQSIDSLKDFRAAMAIFAEDALGALGAVEFEAKRTVQWLQHDRRDYWQQQIKRRKEQVAMARAEVFRRKLAKTADYTPAFSEQKEILRQAEESLRDAEMRAMAVKKWGPVLQQAIFEYHGTVRRMSNIASGDIPRAMGLLERLVESLEAYLRVTAPSGSGPSGSPFGSIGNTLLDEDDARAAEEAEAEARAKAETEAPALSDDGSIAHAVELDTTRDDPEAEETPA